MICGLLGRTLGHSYSPQIHAQLADYSYSLFEKEPEEVESFLKSNEYSGLNVTIPYKKTVIPYCDQLTPIARRLGAVNTIVKKNDGTLLGHNSDYYGFRSMVDRSKLSVREKKVLILGSGGASATAVAVIEDLGGYPIVISRNGENNYNNIHIHYDAAMIINATPVGMYPNTADSPIAIDPFMQLEGVFDLIYNPAHTALLQQAEKRGIVAINGLWMLVAQAKESAELFIDRKIKDDVVATIYNTLRFQTENIVLIGMPGSGKSTVGKALAEKLSRDFIDIDEEIVNRTGRPIPKIFETQGESAFRDLETAVLADICNRSGLVIATGGGCITKERNYPLLRQNGRIVWIKRDLSKLPTAGRPLSQQNKLEELYKIRKPLYEAFSDLSVQSTEAPAITADLIINKIKEVHDK